MFLNCVRLLCAPHAQHVQSIPAVCGTFDLFCCMTNIPYVRSIPVCSYSRLHGIAGNDVGIQGNLDPAILHGDHATIKVSVRLGYRVKNCQSTEIESTELSIAVYLAPGIVYRTYRKFFSAHPLASPHFLCWYYADNINSAELHQVWICYPRIDCVNRTSLIFCFVGIVSYCVEQ